MERVKHTTGPWSMIRINGQVLVIRRDNGDGVAGVTPTDHPAEEMANGRLIAASPALLEAATGALSILAVVAPHYTDWDAVVAAHRDLEKAIKEAELGIIDE